MWTEFAVASILLLKLQEVRGTEKENAIQNIQVIHLIDITTFIVKTKYKITFKNVGYHPTDKYVFELVDSPAFTTFTGAKNETLPYDKSSTQNSTVYIVSLRQELLPEEEYTIKIKLIFPSKLVPSTKFSRCYDEHSFLWRGNSVFYSKYFTKSFRFLFVTDPVFNRNIQTSIMYDSSVKNMLIYYAKNVTPFQYKEILLTFTSPIPVFRVKKLFRSIYVSQFGKIQLEDQVIVENAGPQLLGPYCNTQSDYWMYTHLPKTAENIKFFDVLGNNSKTLVYEDERHKTLKFIPRYSLRQGGWKSTYILQYNVPTYEYVFRNEMEYLLKIRAIDHILNDVMVEDAEIKIVLPDGGTISSVMVPPRFEKYNDTIFHTSLSILGRCTVNLRGKILLEENINDIIIKYQYSQFNFLVAPFFLMFLVESVFFSIILWRKYSENIF
ncbi:dolichyl-diphosphooligosaccharide--protein glycosyltransferase subunit 1-like [Coccinella septempunctata]|uniref:dolichyl-diphosphooligosaccharide--protein glycosyltransferase subunit 1-like n=1 Tax=Coccinella septempunctata TaxID=41139 RepID=UPI001D05FDCF|nr:dolichyl-diphosphooligosaccharide--protein glycosyltransferase subunit 1-like [Coccinella septempunctata]